MKTLPFLGRFLFIALFIQGLSLNAQVTFEKYIQDSAKSSTPCAIIAEDDGYIVYGWDSWDAGSESAIKLTKTDLRGNTVLTKYIWEENYFYYAARFTSLQKVNDNYLIVGNRTTGDDKESVLINLDIGLNEKWRNYFGRANRDISIQALSITDSNFAMAGYSTISDQQYDFHLIKTDSTGNKLWEKSYGTLGDQDVGTAIHSTSDDGYILSGIHRRRYIDNGFWELAKGEGFLIKTDKHGDMEWSKYFTTLNDQGNFYVTPANNGYLVWSTSYAIIALPEDSLLYIEKLDFEGNSIWRTNFYAPENSGISMVRELKNGKIVFAGVYHYSDTRLDAGWIGQLDTNGDLLWERHHLTNQPQPDFSPDLEFVDFDIDADAGFILAGTVFKKTEANGGYRNHTLLIKLDSLGCYRKDCGILPRTDLLPDETVEATSFPNPFVKLVTITVNAPHYFNQPINIHIYDVLGRSWGFYIIELNVHGVGQLSLSRSYFPKGLLLYQIEKSGNSLFTGKIISQ